LLADLCSLNPTGSASGAA